MAWTIDDHAHEKKGGYIGIRGPNGEKIADIFPFAGVGGVGVQQARENAAKIVQAEQLWESLQNLLYYCQEGCPDGNYASVIEAKAAVAGIRTIPASEKPKTERWPMEEHTSTL